MKSIMAGIVVAFAVTAVADVQNVDNIDWSYDTDDGVHAYLYGGYQMAAIDVETSGDIAVPSVLGGMPVTMIDEYAFYNCARLRHVTVPSSVTAIGGQVFKYCGLSGVTIPSSVTSIGDGAFYGSGLQTVSIPSSVKTFGFDMFNSCTNLSSVSLPADMTRIPSGMFRSCPDLKTLEIPSSVTSIGDGAFQGSGFESLYDVKIPSGVKSIGPYLFMQCPNLKTATIPAGITAIGMYAFWDCDSLESVVLPAGVTSVGERAFGYCDSLKSVKIPSTVTSIGDDVFFDSPEVAKVLVDDVAGEVDRVRALLVAAGCDISNITVEAQPTECMVTFDANGGTCGIVAKSVPWGEAVGALPKATKDGKAFMGWYTKKSALGTRILPSTVVEADVTYYARWTDTDCRTWTDAGGIVWHYRIIDAEAEIYNNDLFAIPRETAGVVAVPTVIEDWMVTGIGDNAFYDCRNITQLTIPDGVANIGRGAFFGCKKATAINVPSSVKNIGDYAFAGCDGLADSNGFVIRDGVLCNYAKTGDVTVPSGVKTIGAYAFYGKRVNNVTITEGVTDIGYKAFRDCEYLESVSIPQSLKNLGAEVFSGAFSFTTVYVSDATGEAARVKKLLEDAGIETSDLTFIVRAAEKYKVTFGKNGGTGGDNYVTVTYDEAMPTPRTAPKLSGWTFAGYWDTLSTDEKGNAKGKQYYDGSMKSVRVWDKKDSATLWAKWTNKVTFGKNGGTGGDSYVTCTKGQPMPKRTMPTKSGYVFDGYWSTTGAGGVKYYNADGTSAHVWDKSGSVTLWAKWEKAVSVKVTFGKNGGTGGDDYVTATTGKPMPTPRTAPKKSGWTFGGYWDTLACDAKGNPLGKQYYNSKMESVRNWDKTSAVTLWAKWTVRVTLGKNGGTGGDSYVTVIYNQPFPTRAMPTKSGYTFGGYFVSASSKTGQCYNADGTGTSTMKWTTGGTPTIWALWNKTGSNVVLPVAATTIAAAAPVVVAESDRPIPAGLYSGVLSDGSGAFWLMLDEPEEGYDRTAYLYIALEDGGLTAECEAAETDGILLLTTEDGAVYAFDPVAGTIVPATW